MTPKEIIALAIEDTRRQLRNRLFPLTDAEREFLRGEEERPMGPREHQQAARLRTCALAPIAFLQDD